MIRKLQKLLPNETDVKVYPDKNFVEMILNLEGYDAQVSQNNVATSAKLSVSGRKTVSLLAAFLHVLESW